MTGNWTFGHVAAKYAMEVAIEKARTQNVAVVGIVQSNHIGRLGEYVELAAVNGMIGMVWAGGTAPRNRRPYRLAAGEGTAYQPAVHRVSER